VRTLGRKRFKSPPLALSIVVGGFMFLASLHAAIPPLEFTPGGFFGYATLFGVHAAGRTVLLPGVAGETVATAVAMAIGALIGIGADLVTAFEHPYTPGE